LNLYLRIERDINILCGARYDNQTYFVFIHDITLYARRIFDRLLYHRGLIIGATGTTGSKSVLKYYCIHASFCYTDYVMDIRKEIETNPAIVRCRKELTKLSSDSQPNDAGWRLGVSDWMLEECEELIKIFDRRSS